MKSYKNIYPKIYAYENLHAAWRKAARGKRKSAEVADFEYHLIDNLLQLEEELRLEQQRHAGQMLVEIGKMVGSWQKKH